MMRSVPVVGAPQPWPPPPPPPSPSSSSLSGNLTDNKPFTTRDCDPSICGFTCPPWCRGFPPPAPFFFDSSDAGEDDSSGRISPLMAALIAVLAAAFLLLFYYTVVSRFCRRRQGRRNLRAQILNNDDPEIRLDPMIQDPTRQVAASGLDESFIRQITVFKYRRSDGLIEGTDCAVCLNEFKEEENLRLMPNCEHAFHIPCIDTWLKSHSNCPLCRATMNPLQARPGPTTTTTPNPTPGQNGAAVSLAAMQVQSNNDVVLIVREVDGGDGEVVICHEEEEGEQEGGCVGSEDRENGEEEVRRKGDVNRR